MCLEPNNLIENFKTTYFKDLYCGWVSLKKLNLALKFTKVFLRTYFNLKLSKKRKIQATYFKLMLA